MMPMKYVKAQFFIPLGPEFDADRLILITLSMIAMGVVGLVIWDGVFPDRRDVRILGVLPIPTRTLRRWRGWPRSAGCSCCSARRSACCSRSCSA